MKEKNDLYYYSKAHKELISQLRENDTFKLANVLDYGLDTPNLIKDYKFEYASWPVVVSNERVENFTSFFNKFKALCNKAILNSFDSNVSFEEYLDCPGFLFEYIGEVFDDITDYIYRYDIVYSKDNFKILEVNTGTNIGGWQLDQLDEHFSQLLKEYDFSKSWNVKKENILENVLKMIIKSVRALKNDRDKHDIVFVKEYDEDENNINDIISILNLIFSRLKKELGYSGDLIHCESMSELSIDEYDIVYLNDKKVSAVISYYTEVTSEIQSINLRLTKCYLKGNLVFPDSPFHNLLGNKNILSLLYTAIEKGIFTNEEVELLKRHVPWTHKAGNEYIHKDQVSHKSIDFLIHNKDKLVFKKARSMQGKDVFVGKFISKLDWLTIIEQYGLDRGWLIQEYCEPDEAIMCDKTGWLGPFDFIWGVFDIDFKYSGAFIRGHRKCDAEEENNGVINSASGAIEFTVFENKKLQKVLSI